MNLCLTEQLKQRIAESRGRLYRVALAWCGDAMLADDLAQETMATAISKCKQLRDPSSLFAWLYRILNNKWYRHLQQDKSGRANQLNDEIPSEEPGPSRRCQQQELIVQIRQAVASLPIKERQVITLVDLDEQSYCDVAHALDIPIGTVMSRLHRARKHLLDKLDYDKVADGTDKPNLYRVK